MNAALAVLLVGLGVVVFSLCRSKPPHKKICWARLYDKELH